MKKLLILLFSILLLTSCQEEVSSKGYITCQVKKKSIITHSLFNVAEGTSKTVHKPTLYGVYYDAPKDGFNPGDSVYIEVPLEVYDKLDINNWYSGYWQHKSEITHF